MLVPSSLSRKLKTPTRIGIFFHTPFPSSDMFRILPCMPDGPSFLFAGRESFLHSLLAVNHIGFHLFEYLRHFANTVRRMFGVQLRNGEHGHSYFDYNGRKILASCAFMGIESKVVQESMETESYRAERAKLLDLIGSRRAVVSIAYLERLKGFLLQLQAIQALLQQFPAYRQSVVFLLVGLDAQGCSDFEQSREEVQAMVTKLNASLDSPRPVVVYREARFLTAAERAAFWSVGSILACTPIREGMNAFPLEYTAAHAHDPSLGPGLIILSEFTAPARVLSGALYVNPWSVVDVVATYRKALEMGPDERQGRFEKISHFVLKNPTSTWIDKMLRDMSSIPVSKECSEVSLGFGYFRRVIELRPNFRQLQPNSVGDLWLSARKKALFLDYGGTLVDQDNYKGSERLNAMQGQGSFRSPSPTILHALQTLCASPDTWVFVVSGRSRSEMEQSLQAVTHLGLASEEGYFYRFPDK